MASAEPFRTYDPLNPRRARPICMENWNAFRPIITRLCGARYTQVEILEVLDRSGWNKWKEARPSKAQFASQMRKWKLRFDAHHAQRLKPDIDIRTFGNLELEEPLYLLWRSDELGLFFLNLNSGAIELVQNPSPINSHCGKSTNDAMDGQGRLLTDNSSSPATSMTSISLTSQGLKDDGMFEIEDGNTKSTPVVLLTPVLTSTTISLDKHRLSDDELNKDLAPTTKPPVWGLSCTENDDFMHLTLETVSSELVDLWPGFQHPQQLSQIQLHQMDTVADFLAAARLYDDAFDIFYIQFLCWFAHVRLVPTEISVGRLLKCAVNCARTCRFGRSHVLGSRRRPAITQRLLAITSQLLARKDFPYELERPLILLYQSRAMHNEDRLHSLQLLREAYTLIKESAAFIVLPQEMQDRETLFITAAVEQADSTLHLMHLVPAQIPPAHMIKRASASLNHMVDCAALEYDFRVLLKWCSGILQEHRKLINKALPSNSFLNTGRFRPSAPWVFFCWCAQAAVVRLPLQNSSANRMNFPCQHSTDCFKLDILLALAVIAEGMFGTTASESLFKGVGFSGPSRSFTRRCIDRIDSLLMDRKCLIALVARYELRACETSPKDSQVLDSTSTVLVKEYAREMVFYKICCNRCSGTRDMDDQGSHFHLPRSSWLETTMSKTFPSQHLFGKSPRSSTTSSLQSWANTIRSTESEDQKAMYELARKLCRTSMISSMSKGTSWSDERSLIPNGESGLDTLFGVPSCPSDVEMTDVWI